MCIRDAVEHMRNLLMSESKWNIFPLNVSSFSILLTLYCHYAEMIAPRFLRLVADFWKMESITVMESAYAGNAFFNSMAEKVEISAIDSIQRLYDMNTNFSKGNNMEHLRFFPGFCFDVMIIFLGNFDEN